MNSRTADLLRHPLVLKAAWQKVSSWYRFGEWPSLAEFSRWSVDPTRHQLALSLSLAEGSYVPGRSRTIPYPKTGGMLRHDPQPSVRDQVAFALIGALLAPTLEVKMPNFSFGN